MSLLQSFIQCKNEQLKIAKAYEEAGSLEVAYLAIWSVTEHTVKDVEEYRLKQKLIEDITNWYEYLSGTVKCSRPSITKINCVTEAKNIPKIINIEKVLGKSPAVAKLLQTNGKIGSTKYRDRRNDIAHRATKFKDASTYKDYKNTALSSIEELEKKLCDMEVNG